MLQMFCAILVEFITFAKALSAFERASMWQTAVQLFARMRVADVTPDSISETLRLHLLHTVTQTSKDFLYIYMYIYIKTSYSSFPRALCTLPVSHLAQVSMQWLPHVKIPGSGSRPGCVLRFHVCIMLYHVC